MRFFIPRALSFRSFSWSSCVGVLGERPDEDVAGVVVQHEGVGNAVERDLLADDGQLDGLVQAFPDEGDGDLGPLLAPELLHGVEARDGLRALAVDLGDDVAGLDAQPPGRSPLDGGDDDQAVLLLLDLHPDAEVFPDVVLAHPGEVLGLEEVGVRVQRFEEAADGGVGQLLVVQVLVIAALEDADDGPDLVEGGRPEVLVPGRETDQGQEDDGKDQGLLFHGFRARYVTVHLIKRRKGCKRAG